MSQPVIHCAHTALLEPKDLLPHPKNPNIHSKEQIKVFASILEYQGWRRPITVSNRSGFITRGHGALAAATLLGHEVVPVDYQDYETEYQELADIVADNQLQRLSQMDTGKLTDIMVELKETALDLTLTGFEMKTINSMLSGGMKAIEPPPIISEAPDHGDGDEMETVETVVDGDGESESPAPAPSDSGNIRMVNLIFNESDQKEFLDIVEFFKRDLDMDNMAEIVLTVMKSAFNAHTGESN